MKLIYAAGSHTHDVTGIEQALTDLTARVAAAERVALGAYIGGFPADLTALDAYDRLVGTPARLVMWYEGDPTKTFSPTAPDAVIAHGAMPVITWNTWGSTPQSIVAGTHDPYLHRYLADVAAWGKRVYLRPMWEMNGNWYDWGFGKNGNTAADLVAAWRHIVNIGRAEGANGVRWVWCPNILPATGQTWGVPYAAIYPGDDYVDWLGLDGYNKGTTIGIWRSFETTFRESYDSITSLSGKPLMIAETASSEVGGDKAAWITQAFDDLATMPRVQAVSWFNINKEQDWRINSSPASLVAYVQAAGMPRLHGLLP